MRTRPRRTTATSETTSATTGDGEGSHGEGLGVGHPVSVLGCRGYSRRDMDFDLATMAIVFGAIFLVELPDKTFIATLVLATRFRPLYVWIGVSLAFLVQTAVAVTVGGLLAQLPKRPVEIFAALMFLVGGYHPHPRCEQGRRGGGRDRGGVRPQGRGHRGRAQGDRGLVRRAVPRRVG